MQKIANKTLYLPRGFAIVQRRPKTVLSTKTTNTMRKTFVKPIAALALATAALFSSCSTEEYDMQNISDEIMFQTSLAAPVIAEREINLVDFFDMNITGKFKFTLEQQDQVEKVIDVLGTQRGYTWPECLQKNEDGKYVIDLEKMNGKDMEDLNDLGITVDDKYLPKSTDFIGIDDLDNIFGEGNAINEVDELEITMELENKTDFQITLGIAFANTVSRYNADKGQEEELHEIIDGTEAVDETLPDKPKQIVITARENGQKTTGKKIYTLTFRNIASKIRNGNATGIIISYDLDKGYSESFVINKDDGISMNLKAYFKATIDLSNINN